MNDLWIRFKFWAKTTLISVLVVYIIMFIYNNTGGDRQVRFWWWFGQEPQTSVFVLALVSFIAGVLVTMLVRTTFTTMKQFRLMKNAKAQKELADMQIKASKLQTKPVATTMPAPESDVI